MKTETVSETTDFPSKKAPTDEDLVRDARYYLEGLQKCMRELDKRHIVTTISPSNFDRTWSGMVARNTYVLRAVRVSRKEF